MRGIILCLLFWFLGAGILGFGLGGFWGGMGSDDDDDGWFRFYSSRGFEERYVGWMMGKRGFSFSFISGGGYEEELCQ